MCRRVGSSKHDFEDSTFCGAVGGKPFLAKRLRKFKNFHCQVAHFFVRAVHNIQLEFQTGDSVAQASLLRGEEIRVNLLADSHVSMTVLLADRQRQLSIEFCSLGERVCLSVLGL